VLPEKADSTQNRISSAKNKTETKIEEEGFLYYNESVCFI
jgi:hypothetical protein